MRFAVNGDAIFSDHAVAEHRARSARAHTNHKEAALRGMLTIQSGSGHEVIEYDTEAENGPLDPAIAEAKFDEMMAKGGFAFAETATGEREQIRAFDPETQTRVTIAPQIAGGC